MALETWETEARELAEKGFKKILFMCVKNSARSQLAEAIARHFAPGNVVVISAGSEPSFVRPEVAAVLTESGISANGLYSKSVDAIDPLGIDAVITLCAEEVCPVFLGKARRIHWPLPDPAKVEPESDRLEAFRNCRDELIKRVSFLFAKPV